MTELGEYQEDFAQPISGHGPRSVRATGLWVCTGCGSMQSIEQIRTEHPNAIACCPERKMAPIPDLVGAPKP